MGKRPRKIKKRCLKSWNSPKQLNLKEDYTRVKVIHMPPRLIRSRSTDQIHAGHQNTIQKNPIFIVILSVQKLQNLLEMAPGSAPAAAPEPEMTVSRLSVRRPLHGAAREPGVPDGDSAGADLRLDVGAKVSDLGVSHRQIGVPHTGRILQRAEVKAQISI